MKNKNTLIISFIIIIILSTIDMFSTMWLNANCVNGHEVNYVMAAILDSSFTFMIIKTLVLGIVLWALWRLHTQSEKAFKWGVRGTCAIWGLACINNVVGVVLLW